jgi:hypothetical protein
VSRSVIAPGQGAAGAGVTVPISEAEYQQLVAVSFRLVTSAVVATRRPAVAVTDGSGVAIVTVSSSITSAASLTTDYSFAVGVGASTGASGAAVSESLPALPLDGGDSIVISVAALDVGDLISRVRVTVIQQPVRE